jgi:tryptophan-rich sensory protein
MKGVQKKRSILVLIGALILSYGTGFLGSIFTSEEINEEWYASIRPAITPPDWVFPIVWNILFLLFALSLWQVWIHAKNKKEKKMIGFVYGGNLILNAGWSFMYFGLQNPLLAFFDLLALLVTIILAMRLSWKIKREASWLLVPYLLWVIFAGVLNVLSIV